MAIIRNERKHTLKIDYSNIIQNALLDSIKELNPIKFTKNPIYLTFGFCLFTMLLLIINPKLLGESSLTRETNLIFTLLLLLIILILNTTESLVKHSARAQADSLRIIHGDVEVKRLKANNSIEYVFTSQIKKGDIIKLQEGDLIPLDGEVIEGVATVDESAITGESSPVLKEPGTDTCSSVTGGTRIVADWLLVKVTSEQGETYLDQMINISEDIEKLKTQNETSLNLLLTGLTISFVLVAITLAVILNYLKIKVDIAYIVILLACLIPITTSGLITPIRIAGFNKINQLNILAMSEKTLETAANINVLYLDKTGTITYGNRMAIELIPFGSNSITDVAKAAHLLSYFDQTPEGKSIISLVKRYSIEVDQEKIKGTTYEFNSHTRMSGIDLENGDILRKGASDTIKKLATSKNGKIWDNTDQLVDNIAIQGGTPLLILKNFEIIGLIHLKDIVKITIKDKFKETKRLGIHTILCTGDNNLTAKVIAKESGIDNYIAQSKPEEKISLIRENQVRGLTVATVGDGTNDAPALAQADIGLSMNSGTVAAKEASNMIDLDSDPTKIVDIIKAGREIFQKRGMITVLDLTSNIAKYTAVLPLLFNLNGLEELNIMHLKSSQTAIISILILNIIIITYTASLALKGTILKPISPNKTFQSNIIKFGLGGLIIPFILIKLIDLIIRNLI